jgi:hypothetical protein
MDQHDAADKGNEAERLRIELNKHRSQLSETCGALTAAVRNASDALVDAEAFLDELSPELEQGRSFPNHDTAFDFAKQHVRSLLASRRDSELNVRVLAVASSFSWRFVAEVLPDLISGMMDSAAGSGSGSDDSGAPAQGQSFSTVCSAFVLLVEPTHLRAAKAGRNAKLEEWWKISRSRERDLNRLIQRTWSPELIEHYSLRLAYYKNIPHWHGVLVSDNWLLLGRTSWVNGSEGYELRVGENLYRLFTDRTKQGRDRIKLFESWFSYYKQNSRAV